MRNPLTKLLEWIRLPVSVQRLLESVERIEVLEQARDHRVRRFLSDLYRAYELHQNSRYQDAKRVVQHGYKVFSQFDEDGIIAEIFRRIGTESRTFVEIGCGNGLENNTTYLLLSGWCGVWVDADRQNVDAARAKFGSALRGGRLQLVHTRVTAENVEQVFLNAGVGETLDFLSIDIDFNDYWVWRSVERFQPRGVVIEYNASFGPDQEIVVQYDPSATWNGTSHYGASLKSLERLGAKKGYRLVGCDFAGVNAFFVRDDLVQDRFYAPFTSEVHFEPPRYELQLPLGHPRDVGEYQIMPR